MICCEIQQYGNKTLSKQNTVYEYLQLLLPKTTFNVPQLSNGYTEIPIQWNIAQQYKKIN